MHASLNFAEIKPNICKSFFFVFHECSGLSVGNRFKCGKQI